MLYEALAQPTIFIVLAMGGFLSGFMFDLKSILSYCFKNNKIITQILLFFCTLFMFFVYFYLNLRINYGEFRVFPIFSFGLSFCIQRFLMNNFVANTIIKWYNKHKEKRYERQKKLVEKL